MFGFVFSVIITVAKEGHIENLITTALRNESLCEHEVILKFT